MPDLDYRQIQSDLFQSLPPRSQDVLRRRFGLDGTNKETLDSIGRDLSITRERVRQVEEASMAKLRDVQTEKVQELRRAFRRHLDEHGGLRREDRALEDLGRTKEDHPYVLFFLVLEPDFFLARADELVYPFWTTEQDKIDLAHRVVERLMAEIGRRHQPLPEDDIYKVCPMEKQLVRSCLEVAYRIEQGLDGRYGLSDWPEVCPQRLKDKAFLVLKEANQPLHFTRVTEMINEFNPRWQASGCRNARRALAQTVHNELIRDARFVLVGRGLYALKEWGYEPGTVKDLIVKILRENGHPMTRDEIVNQVLKQRFVERTTVLLNLGRRDHFQRRQDRTYWLAED